MGRRKNKISSDILQTTKSKINSFEYLYNLFIRDCRIRNLSEHSFKYYKNELLKFYKRLERNKIDTSPAKITEEIKNVGTGFRRFQESALLLGFNMTEVLQTTDKIATLYQDNEEGATII